MQARDIMTKEPRTLTLDSTVSEAARIMRELDVGLIPIVDGGDSRHLEGVITDRDIAVRHVAERHSDDCRVSEHMSSTLTTVRPDEDIAGVMERMRKEQVRRIPVVEDGGRLVGIIAQADLAVDTGPNEAADVAKTVKEISEPGEPRH
jgi:CBS domain-containing protein